MIYQNKKILILGLGSYGGGLGAAEFLAQNGADLVVTDIKNKKNLKPQLERLKKYKNIKYILGSHRNIPLNKIDLAVINPAVDLRSKIIQKIKKQRLNIESELGIFLKHCPGKIIAITGTKGKSTTASLIYQILKNAKKDVLLGGNIGVSLLSKLPQIKKNTYVVLEISSFQLDILPQNIPFYISAITNIYQDHLDRYDSFTAYKKSKLSIFQHPARYKLHNLKPHWPRWLDKNKIKIPGAHNLDNITLAAKITRLLKIPRAEISQAIYCFKGLEHRLEFIKKIKGIYFYNDSASTTPDSTIAALNSFEINPNQKIILIAGGKHKGAPLKKLAETINKKVDLLILFGQSAKLIARAAKRTKIIKAKQLKNALRYAYKTARENDIILFSPAGASFDQFKNAKERGKIFKNSVKSLTI